MSGAVFGSDLFGDPVRQSGGILAERFVMPPFTTLDARSGAWQERKAMWLAQGIESEIGRGDALAYQGAKGGDFLGKQMAAVGGTSVFDPVLCELAYRWFCPGGGQVVDPFAGGSVRGIVAALMGVKYWGCELRAEQVSANREQVEKILPSGCADPVWVCGDSREKTAGAPACDLVFTCPPYGDLEVYSDDARDLSTMDWGEFSSAYRQCFTHSLSKLLNDSFAVVVVGNYRDKKTGGMRDMCGLTVSAMSDMGLCFYNDAVLTTPVGTARLRAGQFDVSRKMCKTHQNVLVFAKGSARLATEKLMSAKHP